MLVKFINDCFLYICVDGLDEGFYGINLLLLLFVGLCFILILLEKRFKFILK